MVYDEKRILADIRARLGDHRYEHSLNVAASAKALAEKYGGDTEVCYVAGLLHDVLKEQPRDETLEFFSQNGIVLTELEMSAPKLWHAVAGAAYIKKYYPELPDAAADAVRYHTTGKADMSIEEKILFTADFISADRDYPGVDEMRRRAEDSLESAMKEGLRFTVAELSEKCAPIHPDTVDAYNFILLENRKPFILNERNRKNG